MFIHVLFVFSVSIIVRPQLKFASCLNSFGQPEVIEQFFNAALNQRTTAEKYVILALYLI